MVGLMLSLLLFLSVAVSAPKPMPAMRLAIDNEGVLTKETVTIALLGNTRTTAPMLDKGRAVSGGAQDAVIGDLTAQNMIDPLDLVVLLGDIVPSSTKSNWRAFGDQFAGLIDGSVAPPSALRRIPVVPVVGDRDCVKQPSCQDFAAVFPGFGQDIGFGRVATWQSFDLVVGVNQSWRVVVIDSNKKELGSRWREQVVWLKEAVRAPGEGLIVLLHESPLRRGKAVDNEGVSELMDLISEHAPLMSLRAVIGAGPANSQAFLPEGALGPIHVVAGGGGAPAETLERGLKSRPSDPALAEAFERALDALVDDYASSDAPPSQKAIDEALGSGSFNGFARSMDGGALPTHGWWKLKLSNAGLMLAWRARTPRGELVERVRWAWSKDSGWQAL